MATTTGNGEGQLLGLIRKFELGLRDFKTEARHEPVKYIVMILCAVFLLGLVCYPMFLLFRFSLLSESGSLTLNNYFEVLDRPGLFRALKNSFILGIFVPIGCMALGLPMAWAVSRTNMPLKTLVRALSGIAFVIPSFIGSIAWIFLLAPNSGKLNKILIALFDLETPPFNIFTMSGLIFILIMHFYPLVFFTVSAALDNIDPSYEDAARSLGAGRFRTALGVTFPLVTPAVFSGGILVVLDSLAAFGAPATIGFPGNFHVLTTKIYTLLAHPPKFELAAAVSLPIILLTGLCLIAQRWYLGRRQYTTLTGKVGQAQGTDLGRWRWAAFGVCFLVISVSVLLPMSGLLILSFMKTFGASIAFVNFTIGNYGIFFDDTFLVWHSVQNSLMLSFATATMCILLAIVYVWIVERTNIPGRGILTFIVMLTFGFPAVAMGVAVLLGYIDWIYGTLWILLVAYMAKRIPFAYIFLRNAIKQIMEELEEAARIAGASWLRSVKDVTMPLMKTGMWAAWVLVFSISLRELAMSILLAQPGTEVMAVAIYSFLEDGAVEFAAAVAVLVAALSVVTVVLARRIAGRGVLEVQ
ncbi:MAG: ABC transporter permease [Candidatus Methylomirabilales bacterium]